LKRCGKCGAKKTLEEFYRDSRRKDGRRTSCKGCVQDHNRRYYADNRAGELERRRGYREDHPDDNRQYYADNRDARLAYNRQYYATRPSKRREEVSRRRAMKANAPQGDPADAATFSEILREGICELCGVKGPIHIDHIEPLSKGGEHGWENFAGLCVSCNSSKGPQLLLVSMLSH
jgi:5-methylcytosine-specific restriction endonuclease McrA